jgi:glycosyltransferase involved in cell wall biosynthesis
MRFFERGLVLAQRDADLVLCPSEATMRDCEAHGFDPDRLRVVPFGVDLRRASEADVSATRSHYSIPGPYILWTGTIEPRKNLRGLIGAFRALDRDVDLVLAGPAGWNEDLDALVAGQRERIKPLGFVPDADLRALYAGAELFCYPSLREGFGFPVLEAMAQGTPVVTSAGTSTEGVAGGAASLVDPHDPQAIAGAMRALLDDRALRDRLSEAGAQRARAFTWEHTAEELVKAYEDVAT